MQTLRDLLSPYTPLPHSAAPPPPITDAERLQGWAELGTLRRDVDRNLGALARLQTAVDLQTLTKQEMDGG